MKATVYVEGDLKIGDVLTVCAPDVICAKPVKQVIGAVSYPVYRERHTVSAGGLPIVPLTARFPEARKWGIAEFALLLAFLAIVMAVGSLARCWNCHDAD